jgi:hypothetical protein
MKKLNILAVLPRPNPRPVRWDQAIVARYLYDVARGRV